MDRIRLNPLGGMGGGDAMPKMPQIGAPVHMASRVNTPEHNYLGHFGQQQFLKAGHNTNFIAKATAHSHGQFRAKAQHAGMSTASYARKEAGAGGKLGKQARLAQTLMGMNKR